MAANLRVLDPLTPAYRHMKAVLFQPFDIQRWFVFGFCAWLATLGQGGGGGWTNFNLGNRPTDIQNQLERAKQWITDNMDWLIPVAIASMVLMLALWVLFVWLSSRGRFMFLHGVALNRAEIKVPWSRYEEHGNTLCMFRLILGFVMGAALMVLLGLLGVILFSMFSAQSAPAAKVVGATILGLISLMFGVAFAVISKFTTDFVVPIMFLRHPQCMAAWKEFSSVLKSYMGPFILYVLVSVVLHLVIGTAVFLLTIVTCCVAGCLLAIPYVGTVLFLPVLVFLRAYSLHFLAQLGPEYVAWGSPQQTPEAQA